MAGKLIGTPLGFRLVNAALVLLAGIVIASAACGPAAPQIDTATVWTDTVKRGELLIERRGAGQVLEDESGSLYAQLRIPESQSFEIELGQPATLDLTFAQAPARVVELGDRIEQGVRMIRLEFTEGVPDRALPGMSIDGTITVDTISDALFVGKPAYGRSNSRLGLFKLDEDRRFARRVPVQTGMSSANLIQILDGLQEGDEVILSDMSRFDANDMLALR